MPLPALHELAWAAGLYVGEGSTYSQNGRYIVVKISMHDERAIKRFLDIVVPHLGPALRRPSNPRVIVEHYKYQGQDKTTYTVRFGGSPGLGVARTLFPYIEGTDKGDQMKRVAIRLGLEL